MGKNIFVIGTYTLNKNYKIFYNYLKEKNNNKLYFYFADDYTTSTRMKSWKLTLWIVSK